MVLSHAIKKISDYSLVLCGRQAIDGDTAQVGPQVAEKLDISQITYVEDILNFTDKKVEVKKLIENGFEIQETKLPALLTFCAASSAETRPASAKRLQKYKNASTYSELVFRYLGSGLSREDAQKRALEETQSHNGSGAPIEEWSIADLEFDEKLCGLGGSPTWVKQIVSVVLTSSKHKRVSATDEGISSLVRELIDDHILD
jgi:electron transfer flavoprotein beta subunit